ncbi:hypothetical protein [Paenibacillus piscarius]|uniref:hypothetical protein n=1 Tax=Paenibacillus piscarius TaxID=1089681 RepID=UPI001EE7F557|nr:hypothetical protein [Paenibacillus piscarius]
MNKKPTYWITGITQVALVIIIHLGLFVFLQIKTVEWPEVTGAEVILTYCAPVFLLYATCIRSLKTKKLRYNLIWLLISLLPSTAILFKLKEIASAEPVEPVFIEFHFAQGYLELMLFFPVIYSVIQLILWAAMWFMILSKE